MFGAPMSIASIPAPDRDCPLCPRLVLFRQQQREKYEDWHNAPVPSFGPVTAELLITGLAPGLQGANKTGRPFTGDYAGDLLYATLLKFGFAEGSYQARPDDGLRLVSARITNAVRCVPPQNKPVGAEMTACRPFLAGELGGLPNLRAVIALGRIAHDNILTALSLPRARHAFGHAAQHSLSPTLALFDSYHCSRYNTNTGRLTPQMFEQVFAAVRTYLDR